VSPPPTPVSDANMTPTMTYISPNIIIGKRQI
jgi:hypothetical protein